MTSLVPQIASAYPDSLTAGDRGTAVSVPRRHDIDGLRALAVLLVVIYHVWLGRVSGGVDVFLMLSAFFLTSSFLRRLETGSGLGLARYWVRTFKRLLPASVVVLVAVLVATYLLLPENQWQTIWQQSWASLFYVQNWQLAATAVDYYAPHGALVSPLQHFWSLSVQGQVFILWPLLFALTALIVRLTRVRPRTVLFALFGAVFVASLAFSIIETSQQQELAYFDTRTRLWEFALGSLVALALPFVRLPRWARVVLGWCGLVALLVCGLVLDVRGGFPGYLALWPTLACAAIVLAGTEATRFGPGTLLSSRPLRRLGTWAYALYLVHWPVLIFWFAVTGRDSAGILAGTMLIVVSIALAYLLHRFVEDPLRSWKWVESTPRRGAAVILAAVLVVAVPLSAWQLNERRVADLAQDIAIYPGAAILIDGPTDALAQGVRPVPLPTALDAEWVALDSVCEGPLTPRDELLLGSCLQTLPYSPAKPTVVVVGDSHAQQFMGALLPLADEDDWNVVALLKGGCSFGVDNGKCPEWSEASLEYVLDLHPEAVFTVGTAAEPDGPAEQLVPGFGRVLTELTRVGIDVIAVRDNPRFSDNRYECALELGADADECRVALEDALAAENPLDAVASIDGVHTVDLTPYICPDELCSTVIGNVYVYLDNNHLTGTYAATLSPMLRSQLTENVLGAGAAAVTSK